MRCKFAATPPDAWIVPTSDLTTPNVLIAQGTSGDELRGAAIAIPTTIGVAGRNSFKMIDNFL